MNISSYQLCQSCHQTKILIKWTIKNACFSYSNHSEYTLIYSMEYHGKILMKLQILLVLIWDILRTFKKWMLGCRSQIWNEAVRNLVISIKVSTDVSLVTMVMHERQGIIANFSHQLHVTSHVEISSKVAANCFVRPNSWPVRISCHFQLETISVLH